MSFYFRVHFFSDPFRAGVPEADTWGPDSIDRRESSKFVSAGENFTSAGKLSKLYPRDSKFSEVLMFAIKIILSNWEKATLNFFFFSSKHIKHILSSSSNPGDLSGIFLLGHST